MPRPGSRPRESGSSYDAAELALTSSDVKARAASGVALLLGRGVVFRVLGLLGSLVLARLLTPEDFGLVAIGLAVVAVGQLLAGAGLGAQLISRAAPPSLRELRAITGMQLIITTAIGAVAAAVAAIVGGAALATAVMMVALPITAIRSPATLLFTRRMEFSRTVRIEIVEILSYLVFAVGTAALGWGVWSLALATVVRSVAGAFVAVRLSPVGLVHPSWDPGALRPLLAFGARFQLATVVGLGHDTALTAGIAAVGGLTLLGLWSFAWRILQAPMLLFEALFSVGFPTLARLNEAGTDDEAMKELIEGLVTAVCVGMATVMCPLVAASPAAVPLLFGDAWSDVSDILPGAGVAIVLGAPISTVLYGLLYARNDPRTALKASVVDAIVRLAVTFALLPGVGAAAIGIGWAASVLAQMTITLRRVRELLDVRLLRCVVPPFLAATMASVGGWLTAVELGENALAAVTSCLVAGAGYLVLLAVLAPRHLRRSIELMRSAYRALRSRPVAAT